jgi:MoaA/NifB/PqqE/SkfB family radical SAM enzyme
MPGHDKLSYSRMTKVDDSFEVVLSNLISIQDVDISKSITFVYDHKNVLYISELADILYLLNIRFLVLNEVRYPVRKMKITSPNALFDYKRKLLDVIIDLSTKFELYNQTVYISTLIPETLKQLFSSINNIVLLDRNNTEPRVILDANNRIRTCLQSTKKIEFYDFKKQIERYSTTIINDLIKNDDMCACVLENSLFNRI